MLIFIAPVCFGAFLTSSNEFNSISIEDQLRTVLVTPFMINTIQNQLRTVLVTTFMIQYYSKPVEDSSEASVESPQSPIWPQYQLAGKSLNLILITIIVIIIVKIITIVIVKTVKIKILNQMTGGAPGGQHYPPQVEQYKY